ncbi:MFS transporter [Shewanella surugensis]|uniref:MFS transporter n=1 Tax=Shewanella surugensis TaxID=212020 RepID=A0ABT0L8W7_9GAMM|nr:MFS transporter [Shewanella surugensis]MCL1124139.1 MFS transporter [Shewanella surugensis]
MTLTDKTDLMKNEKWHWKSALFLIWLCSLGFYFHQYMFRLIPSLFVPHIHDGNMLNPIQLNMVLFVFWFAYVAFQSPASVIVDKLSFEFLLLIMSLLHISGILLLAISTHFYMVAMALFILGIASSFSLVFSLYIAKNIFTQKMYSLALGIIFAIGGTGAILSSFIFTLLFSQYGPSTALKLLTFIPVILVVVILFFMMIKKRRFLLKSNAVVSSLPSYPTVNNDQSKIIKKHANLMKSYAYVFFHALPMVSFYASWLFPFMEDKLGAHNLYTETSVATVFIGYIIGSPLAGWLTKMFYHYREFILFIISLLGMVISIFVIYATLSNMLTALLLLMLGMISSFTVMAISITADIAPKKTHSLSMSISSQCINLGGAVALLFIAGVFYWFDIASFYPNLKEFHVILFIIPVSYAVAMLIALSMAIYEHQFVTLLTDFQHYKTNYNENKTNTDKFITQKPFIEKKKKNHPN